MINERNARRYCRENLSLVENYEKALADPTQMWICHHKAEVLPCGRYSSDVLDRFGLYYDRPASELIFLTRAEHNTIHRKGMKLSEASRKRVSLMTRRAMACESVKAKLSAAHKGKTPWMKGRRHSEESKRKISESVKLANMKKKTGVS